MMAMGASLLSVAYFFEGPSPLLSNMNRLVLQLSLGFANCLDLVLHMGQYRVVSSSILLFLQTFLAYDWLSDVNRDL